MPVTFEDIGKVTIALGAVWILAHALPWLPRRLIDVVDLIVTALAAYGPCPLTLLAMFWIADRFPQEPLRLAVAGAFLVPWCILMATVIHPYVRLAWRRLLGRPLL